MKVCALQPNYSQSVVEADYKNCEPPRNLFHLLPEAQVDHVFLNKATTYCQLKELEKQSYDIFVNLCTGCLDWDADSSIDLTHSAFYDKRYSDRQTPYILLRSNRIFKDIRFKRLSVEVVFCVFNILVESSKETYEVDEFNVYQREFLVRLEEPIP